VRIVSATHKDLAAEVQAGRFRQDLFYRLNVIRIPVPALRERLQDLPAICAALMRRIAADAGVESPPALGEEALRMLMRQPFPGNVRELENVLHRALALATSDRIEVHDLGIDEGPLAAEDVRDETVPAPPGPPAAQGGAADALPSDLQAYLDDIEREVLHRALQKHRYNRTAAGESLGLSLRQMRYRMARLGVLADKVDGDRTDGA
jgi:two-component system response regulator PilR (NtrC family)